MSGIQQTHYRYDSRLFHLGNANQNSTLLVPSEPSLLENHCTQINSRSGKREHQYQTLLTAIRQATQSNLTIELFRN